MSGMMPPGDGETLWLLKSKGIRSMIRSRSLTVTALSNGDYCMISSPMKFQLSPATGCTGSYRKETIQAMKACSASEGLGRARFQ